MYKENDSEYKIFSPALQYYFSIELAFFELRSWGQLLYFIPEETEFIS
jgi:hypothetical protein